MRSRCAVIFVDPECLSQILTRMKSASPALRTTPTARVVFDCRTISASTAPCTSRRMHCPTPCASYCAPCQPSLRAFFSDRFDLPLLHTTCISVHVHQKSTCLAQLNIGPCVVQLWLRTPRIPAGNSSAWMGSE